MNAMIRMATPVMVALLMVPATAMAADGAVPDWGRLVSAIVNFSIYLAILVKFGRGPVLAFFAGRRSGLLARVEAAAKTRAEAEAALGALKAKVDGLEGERKTLLAETRELAERERERVVATAESQAEKMLRDAKLQAEAQAAAASEEFRMELVDRAMKLAQARLANEAGEAARRRWVENGIKSLQAGAVARA
jgi:F-type H+-transporting ATPase subunit b